MRNRLLVVAAVTALVIAVALALVGARRADRDGRARREVTETAPTTSSAGAESSSAAAASSTSVAPHAPSVGTGAPAATTSPTTVVRGDVAIGSPRQTVATQERLLREGDDDAFRSTFLPEVRPELTKEAIESCRKRLGRHDVRPDWEVAEDSVEAFDGGAPHRVVRVSMFGKSMTGFHETSPGEWRADAAWCVPIW